MEEVDGEGIKDTIKEVREVLELKPFPWEWVYAVTGYLSLNYIKANKIVSLSRTNGSNLQISGQLMPYFCEMAHFRSLCQGGLMHTNGGYTGQLVSS